MYILKLFASSNSFLKLRWVVIVKLSLIICSLILLNHLLKMLPQVIVFLVYLITFHSFSFCLSFYLIIIPTKEMLKYITFKNYLSNKNFPRSPGLLQLAIQNSIHKIKLFKKYIKCQSPVTKNDLHREYKCYRNKVSKWVSK